MLNHQTNPVIEPAASFSSIAIEFFDPPMCCPTGLCGPTLDQTLLDVNEMIVVLEKEGHHVERYQMNSHPHAFLGNTEVMQLVREKQLACLPIIFVNGKKILEGRYPTINEIQTALNGDN